jgi:hypothetical protein
MIHAPCNALLLNNKYFIFVKKMLHAPKGVLGRAVADELLVP